jgi:hypothetical protein
MVVVTEVSRTKASAVNCTFESRKVKKEWQDTMAPFAGCAGARA